MSDLEEVSDEIPKEMTREEKIVYMDSLCLKVKGKQTYQGLTRKQWQNRYLDWDPDQDIEELSDPSYHIVELAQLCESKEKDADLVSVNSEDDKTWHEYKGKKYLAKDLLDLWEFEADEAKQNFKEHEKNNRPAKKQKTDKSDKSDESDKADKADKSDGAGAKGAKAKAGNVWSRFINGNRTVIGPSIYKKFCEETNPPRDWELPVKFTSASDGTTIFKVLDKGKHETKYRWARNPEQNLANGDGEDYY